MSDDEKSLRLPACADCARRKTKCDRTLPCASCVAAKLQCHYTQKRPEKKRRVLHSSRYEDSLKCINRQLEALSNAMQSLVERNEAPDRGTLSNDASRLTPMSIHTTIESSRDAEGELDDAQGGDAVESSADLQAAGSVENMRGLAASSNSSNAIDTHATVVNIVQTLLQDVKALDSATTSRGSSFQADTSAFSHYPELLGLALPPMDTVLRVLALAKRSSQRYFIDIPHTDENEFAELCQRLYFPTQPFTVFAWIDVNCGLFYLFRDLDKSHYKELRLTIDQVSESIALCSENIDRAVQSLKLCVSSSLEAVGALACAAGVSMDCGKGLRAWRLVSTSARMSVDLGLHRLPPGYNDRRRSHQRRLFWYVYSMDRTLAFNFGRSPTIRNIDVTTELPTHAEDFKSKWEMSFLEWIDFVRVQSEIYETLLCAKARQEPQAVRVRKAYELGAEVSRLKDNFAAMMDQKGVDRQGTARDARYSIDIGFFSILTLIYRVLPPDDILSADPTASGERHPLRVHSLCLEAGRAALNALVCGWNVVSNTPEEDVAKTFINWTFLFFPFMPYIAVLSHQIATGDERDLKLLRDVLKIVETAAEASSAMKKVHKAFSGLFGIAESWAGMTNGRAQNAAQELQAQSVTTATHSSSPSVHGYQGGHQSSAVDDSMTAPAMTDFFTMDWQDSSTSHQDWDMIFNEFDLGPGADSARDMMPWVEQHIGNFNTFN